MTVTIQLEDQEVAWLTKRIKGGLKKKNRQQRLLILKKLATVPSTRGSQKKAKANAGKKNQKVVKLKRGTTAFTILEAYENFPAGLTALEAAELTNLSPLASAIASTSDHKRRGLIRVVGVRSPGRSNVLAITTKGKAVMRQSRKEGN